MDSTESIDDRLAGRVAILRELQADYPCVVGIDFADGTLLELRSGDLVTLGEGELITVPDRPRQAAGRRSVRAARVPRGQR